MIYNDFQFPSDAQLELINKNFSKQTSLDRSSILINIQNNLNTLINSCLNLSNNTNSSTRNSILKACEALKQIYNNIAEIFNVSSSDNSINNFNIFSFLKKLNLLNMDFFNWLKFEKKEYYKLIIENSIKELNLIFNNILNSLENSNYYLFKHM